jgi:hypothetical protein
VQARSPEGFIGVDIADSRHHGLVQECSLDPGVPSPQGFYERARIELRIEWISGNVRNDGRHQARPAVTDELVECHSTEGSLVDESQLPTTIGEGDSNPQVLLSLRSGRLDQELTAHPQMSHHREVATV